MFCSNLKPEDLKTLYLHIGTVGALDCGFKYFCLYTMDGNERKVIASYNDYSSILSDIYNFISKILPFSKSEKYIRRFLNCYKVTEVSGSLDSVNGVTVKLELDERKRENCCNEQRLLPVLTSILFSSKESRGRFFKAILEKIEECDF